jgi:hypothetical protein
MASGASSAALFVRAYTGAAERLSGAMHVMDVLHGIEDAWILGARCGNSNMTSGLGLYP